jgi:hypothetical protein
MVAILPIMSPAGHPIVAAPRAQNLGKSTHCLHISQFCGQRKCSAAKVLGLPTGPQKSIISVRHIMLMAWRDRATA